MPKDTIGPEFSPLLDGIESTSGLTPELELEQQHSVAFIRFDKTIALCGIKPLNFSSTHDFPFETCVKDSVKSNKENPAVQPVT